MGAALWPFMCSVGLSWTHQEITHYQASLHMFYFTASFWINGLFSWRSGQGKVDLIIWCKCKEKEMWSWRGGMIGEKWCFCVTFLLNSDGDLWLGGWFFFYFSCFWFMNRVIVSHKSSLYCLSSARITIELFTVVCTLSLFIYLFFLSGEAFHPFFAVLFILYMKCIQLSKHCFVLLRGEPDKGRPAG